MYIKMNKSLVLFAAILLSGCATTNEEKGMALGATLGGIVGPVSGSSETLSLLGVIAGGWVGSEIGKEFDKQSEADDFEFGKE